MATYDYHLKNVKKNSKTELDSAIEENNKNFENQKKAVQDNYNYQINATEKSYADDYRENAIQKLVNERMVAESMSNMGLRDSGLNRTQMTANQLSYGNNKAALDRQKQAQVDALAQQLAATLSEIDINKSAAAASIRQSYDNRAIQTATELYNADVEAQTERYKADLATAEKLIEKSNKAVEDKEDERKSDYKALKTRMYDNDHDDETKLKMIYNYALDWDLDINELTYTNAEIDALLSTAGLSKPKWMVWVRKQNGEPIFNLKTPLSN